MSALVEMATLDIDAGFRDVLEYKKHGDDPLECNAEEFIKVVETRRSVRVYDEETPVPEAVMNKCLDLAMLSANSSNLQPWEFYWVRTPEKKAELVRLCMSQPTARTAAELIVCVGRIDTWKRNTDAMLEKLSADPTVPKGALDYYRLVCPMIYTMGWNVLALMKHMAFNMMGLFKPLPREPSYYSGMRNWATKSVCLAASTLMLAFRAHGFDTCPMEGVDQKRIRKLLGVPRGAAIPMVISVGKRTKGGVYGDRIRFDRDWFVKEV